MIAPRDSSRRKTPNKYILLGCIILVFLLWIWAIYFIKATSNDPDNGTNFSLFQKQFHIPAYTLSLHDYFKSIPSIQYDYSQLQQSLSSDTTPQEVKLFQLNELMSAWDLDNTSKEGWMNSPAHPNKGSGIIRLDFQNSMQRRLAIKYREAEMPFIVYNIPLLDETAEREFSMETLLSNFGSEIHRVEKSSSNRFMYYSVKGTNKGGKTKFPTWTPPQEDIPLTFADYLVQVELAESFPDVNRNHPLYYLTINAATGARTEWVTSGLPFFALKDPFFVIEPEESRGINCRFGMKGVAAAVHYDGGRNFIAMVRGRKRYVLLPPSECSKLHLYPRGHPSARHSAIDWSNATAIREHGDLFTAQATEVVLSMGEVLYLPSYWFHYIISQDASIQCNTRSGDSLLGREHIRACGFYSGK